MTQSVKELKFIVCKAKKESQALSEEMEFYKNHLGFSVDLCLSFFKVAEKNKNNIKHTHSRKNTARVLPFGVPQSLSVTSLPRHRQKVHCHGPTIFCSSVMSKPTSLLPENQNSQQTMTSCAKALIEQSNKACKCRYLHIFRPSCILAWGPLSARFAGRSEAIDIVLLLLSPFWL